MQKMLLESIGNKLNVKDLEDWYSITGKVIYIQAYLYNNHLHKMLIEQGGATLLYKHDGSFIKLITTVYPDYNWKIWKFKQAPHGYWKEEKNQRDFMDGLSSILNIKSPEDWYNISARDIAYNGGYGLLNLYNNSHIQIIQNVYKEHNFPVWRFKVLPVGHTDKLRTGIKNKYLVCLFSPR